MIDKNIFVHSASSLQEGNMDERKMDWRLEFLFVERVNGIQFKLEWKPKDISEQFLLWKIINYQTTDNSC